MPVTFVDITDQQDVGQRLDNFLLRRLKGVPRQHIYRILRKGEVRVNGGRIKAQYRLQANDRIRIPPIKTRDEVPVTFSEKTAESLREAYLYEDDDYLILNKPSGLAVHGGSGLAGGVVEILRVMTGNQRIELIHRLDRDTSGCLALAKNRNALSLAQAQFRQRSVKKVYEVFVHGSWSESTRVVQKRLARYETKSGERRVRVDANGQSARTDFEVLDRAAELATRLQATLHTGRTHQIRVHTWATGHPVLGDDKYILTDKMGQKLGQDTDKMEEGKIKRLCLHARKLAIPLGTKLLKAQAPLPVQMESLWTELKTSRSSPT